MRPLLLGKLYISIDSPPGAGLIMPLKGEMNPMTISEMSVRTGVSVKTLRYYDKLGLLKPAQVTEAGYRMYDEGSLERLQMIRLFREMEFPLKTIGEIMNQSDFERNRMLEMQIERLEAKKIHLENVIALARGIRGMGARFVNVSNLDLNNLDEHVVKVQEFCKSDDDWHVMKTRHRSPEMETEENAALTAFFEAMGKLRTLDPENARVQVQVENFRQLLNEHFYPCDARRLGVLGKMCAGGGALSENIDAVGGDGTAAFVADAIKAYVSLKGQ